MSTSDQQQLQLDYAQTTGLVRDLADSRFKLLALVPTISGAAVAFLGQHPRPAQLLAVGALGLTATVGIVLYELRNTQVYDYAVDRAAALERELDPARAGGLFGGRPASTAAYERGLALVHAAAIGGWAYLVSWGGLHLLGVHHSQRAGGLIAVLAAVFVLVAFLRLGSRVGAGSPEGGAARATTAPNAAR